MPSAAKSRVRDARIRVSASILSRNRRDSIRISDAGSRFRANPGRHDRLSFYASRVSARRPHRSQSASTSRLRAPESHYAELQPSNQQVQIVDPRNQRTKRQSHLSKKMKNGNRFHHHYTCQLDVAQADLLSRNWMILNHKRIHLRCFLHHHICCHRHNM